MGRFLPADFSQGDPNTVGGYRAAHGRPPAFEGSDGASYSVEIVCDDAGSATQAYAAYLLFVRWRADDPVAVGHLETEYIAFADSEAEAMEQIGHMPLQTARAHLESLIMAKGRHSPARGNGEAEVPE
jgi:hypothetical protein